ncbi:hypothetical protein [Catalinimonas niigatensis]|uniref:hypothetical protein n=1 Tax=Catalinimonas niigatensis TaxID=1397264 RepID=UPI0026663EDB|nr:hypothetical protein [Catalinimonas niigatensis]WPP50593.1 hypothetical protein PZB72_28420 [Catalinimonas niigatensis]
MLKDQDENADQEIEKKIDVAEQQATKLSARADMLRKFAEKYRDSSAEQLYGWEKLLSKLNTEESPEA